MIFIWIIKNYNLFICIYNFYTRFQWYKIYEEPQSSKAINNLVKIIYEEFRLFPGALKSMAAGTPFKKYIFKPEQYMLIVLMEDKSSFVATDILVIVYIMIPMHCWSYV